MGTLGVLASGVLLVVLGPTRSRAPLVTVVGQRVDLMTVHQALFAVFAVTAGLHLLARAVRAVELVTGRARRAPGGPARVPGRAGRGAGLTAVLVLVGLAAALLLPLAAGWHEDRPDRFDRPPGTARHR